MFKKSKKAKTSYGIIGLGRFGTALALELAQSGVDLTVIDRNEEKVALLRDYTESAYVVSVIDKKALADTGIQNCDVVVVCIGEQFENSILTTLNLVSLGVPTVISKAASAEQGEILEKLGAEVVYPEKDMGIRLAHRLEASLVLDYIQLSEKLNISKQKVPNALIGKTVKGADLRAKFGINIIAIENGTELIESISPDYQFRNSDILFVAGTREGLTKFGELE